MSAKKKYYAIKEGRKSNLIVTTWKECEELTKGCKNVFKSFKTLSEAEEYLNGKTSIEQNKIIKSAKIAAINKKAPKGKKLNFTIENELYTKFINKCDDLGFDQEKAIKLLIKEWTE